jgi:hypothetical protein
MQRYIDDKLDGDGWDRVLRAAGLAPKVYQAGQDYLDEEAVLLLCTAANAADQPISVTLEEFGQFIAPALLHRYRALIRPDWTVLDLIAHTEDVLHEAVRRTGARPPVLICERPGPDQLVINYSSPRRMCGIAKGIVRGLARELGQEVSLNELSCFLKGDPHCRIAIRLDAGR